MADASAIRILVVDDDARSARLLGRLLSEDGFEVEVVTDGASAIARLSRGTPPDALVTDFRMPTVDGLVIARYARSIAPSLPVFVVTAYPEMVHAEAARLCPGAEILPKPLGYSELMRAIRAHAPHYSPAPSAAVSSA